MENSKSGYGQCEPQLSGFRSRFLLDSLSYDRNKDDIVDSQDGFEHRKSEKGNPSFRAAYPFHMNHLPV